MKKLIICVLAASTLTGCMGRKALTQKALKFNMEVTEHRWGREGMFLLMTPVYFIFGVADLLVFNSVEFWTGENPLDGKNSLLALPKEDVQKMFDQHKVTGAHVKRIDDRQAELHVEFEEGDRVTFDVNRAGESYTVSYRGVEFYNGLVL